MEEPELDLSPLDPFRDRVRFARAVARVGARALAYHRARRAAVRRGATALVLAAAAGLALWLGAPRRAPVALPDRYPLLDWAVHNAGPDEVLGLGGSDEK